MRIGMVGAGMIGSTWAEPCVEAGHDVRLASCHPGDLLALVAILGPLATAGTPAEAVAFGDVVRLTFLRAIPNLARELASSLTRKVVVDSRLFNVRWSA